MVSELGRSVLSATGQDGRSWLEGLLTCSLQALDQSHGAYGLLLSRVGKIQTDLEVLARGDGLLLSTAEGRAAPTLELLEEHLIMEEVELQSEEGLALLRLIGPRASSVGPALPGHVASGSVDWLGLGGMAVMVARERVDEAVEKALQLGGEGALAARPEDWEALRILRGFPRFGSDYGPDDNPHQARLDRLAVSWTKGCYLGQEVVCMQDMRGKLKRRLVPLRLSARTAPVPGEPVLLEAGGDAVGSVTSSSLIEPDLVVAMASLRAPHFENEKRFSVAGTVAEILERTERR